MVEVHEVAIILIRQETKYGKQNDSARDVTLMWKLVSMQSVPNLTMETAEKFSHEDFEENPDYKIM